MIHTILVVDDNPAMRDNMEDILRDRGYETFSAGTCSEGSRVFLEKRPDVALLDLKLPDGLGTELLSRIKDADPDCVCIIVTAFADIDSAVLALERGAFHYLHKPVRPKELLQLLDRAFEMIDLRREKAQAEDALRRSEEKYRTLVENLNVGVYRSSGDMGGPFLQANSAMAKLFGFDSVDEFMAVEAATLFSSLEERIRFLEELAREGSVRDRVIRCQKKDGALTWVSSSATAQMENDRIVWIDGVLEDITERRKLEEQLRHAQKMEAVGTLAGGVAHDFNNILTAILGYANIIQMKMLPDEPIKHYLDNIIISSEKAARLIGDLLAFSRKQVISLRPVSVNAMVRKMESLLCRLIGEDIELKTALAAEDRWVLADGPQLEQVVMNIATNARAAMPEGGVFLIETGHAELDEEFVKTHGYGSPGSYACIFFTDTGTGMAEKVRERIFEPFFTTKPVGKGTGLGLSIAYGIVKQHSGYINAYSEPGKGTTFKLYLPVVCAAGETAEQCALSISRGGNETVLLAEDNAEVRIFEKELLEQFGYEVIEACDGDEAVALYCANSGRIDLLVLDVVMPKKNGKEVYEAIRGMNPKVKALFTSGYTGDILSRKGVLEGGLHFCPKPVFPRDFLAKVRGALDER